MSSTEQIEWMVRRYRQLAATVGEMQTEMAQITAEINELVDVGWSIEVDGVPASKRKGRRQFSMFEAVTLLTPEERSGLLVQRYDEKAVRELIEARGLLDQCMEDAGRNPSVVLR